jgi:hypothetical protein
VKEIKRLKAELKKEKDKSLEAKAKDSAKKVLDKLKLPKIPALPFGQ